MTIHVPVAELRQRIDELLDAVRRGEEVVIEDGGTAQARLVAPVGAPGRAGSDEDAETKAERRRKAFGMYKHLIGDGEIVVRNLKPSEDELDERLRRKFGPPR